ncbi:MAG: FtsQ-type POTRA domain-containing protein [Lachnospiraceae bacterium]|nr:FtsQ-type POTRA domain-containing protein [Lachnospiraceae bacterium]
MNSRRSHKGLWFLLGIVILAATVYILLMKVFTVRDVNVTGNELYSEEQIKNSVLNDDYSFSTLYVYFRYKFGFGSKTPFIDSVEVEMNGPHGLDITVHEKGILGYIYIDAVGQNAYFDKDGFVVEITSSSIDDVPKVGGLNVSSVVLYEMLEMENADELNDLLLLTSLLKKYGIHATQVEFDSAGKMSALSGKITINIGSADYLTEKIMRLSYILDSDELKGKKGVLHVENWTTETTDIIFDPD